MSSFGRLCLLPLEEQDEILNGPGLAPPSGVTPNFQDPPNLTIVAEVITPILFAIVAILVLLRFSSKVVAQRSVHIEDSKVLPEFPFRLILEANSMSPVLCFLGFVSTCPRNIDFHTVGYGIENSRLTRVHTLATSGASMKESRLSASMCTIGMSMSRQCLTCCTYVIASCSFRPDGRKITASRFFNIL